MKNTTKRLLSMLLAVVLVLSLGSAAFAAVTIYATNLQFYSQTGVTVDPDTGDASASLYVGQTLTLTTAPTPSDYNQGYTWDSSDKSVATVSTSGVVTAKAEGSANISVKVKTSASEYKTLTCALTVGANAVEKVEISGTGIADGKLSIKKGETLQLTGTATFLTGAKQTSGLSWNTSDGTVVGISSSGKITANGTGTATVTAKLGDKSATLQVSVYDLSSISIDGFKETEHLSIGAANALNKSNAEIKVKVADSDKRGGFTDAQLIKLAGGVKWESADKSIVTVTKSTTDETAATINAVAPGKTTVTATVGKLTATITVEVYGVKLSSNNILLAAGTTVNVTATYYPVVSDAKLAFAMGGSSIFIQNQKYSAGTGSVTVNAPSNLSEGTRATLTTTLSYNSVSYTATANVTIGKNAITAVKTDPEKLTLSVGATKSLTWVTTPTNASYKSAAWNSSDTSIATVSSAGLVTAKKAGTCYIYIDLVDENGITHRGSCALTVGGSDKDISVNATVGTSVSMKTIYSQIATAFYNQNGVSASSASFKLTLSALETAQLYTDSTLTTPVSNGTYTASRFSAMYLSPKSAGSYAIQYVCTYGTKSMDGTITFTITGGSVVNITLDSLDSYQFSGTTSKNNTSAYEAIDSVIYSLTRQHYDYLVFSNVDSSSARVGTLYDGEGNTNLTNSYYYRGSSYDYSVYDLYFVPATAGTYVRTFTAYSGIYSSIPTTLGTFTLRITVPEGASSGDLFVNTTVNSTVAFDTDTFESWFEENSRSNYYLSYVTFNSVSNSTGSFKCDSTAFTPGSGLRFYSDTYSGTTGTNAKYLDDVTFTASRYTGTVRVGYTCYGGSSANSTNVVKSGILYICVTSGEVNNVSYAIKNGTAQQLSESDFLKVYQSAMGSTASNTRLYIQLLDVPSAGTLYYNYKSASSTGTKLTAANCGNNNYYVNGASNTYSISSLTYVPAAASGSGSISVPYVAYSSTGTPVYTGSITFTYATAKSLSCYSNGYTFKASDFSSTADTDPIANIVFTQPASGALYLNYANGSGTAVTSQTRFYTVYSSTGAYPITSLTYIPKAGFSGSVTLSYAAVTVGGSSYTGTITMTVSSKTNSSQFRDVTSSGVGSWAADSIDFAYSWGLVNGITTTTFDPNSTMTRAQLVTILYRAAGSPAVSGGTSFADVASGAYYYNAVIWAAKNGIVNGVSATSFNPNGNVTREQVASILYRYASYKGMSTSANGSLSSYTDVSKVSSYATTALTWAVGKGIITSTSATAKVLTPGGSATRAQVSVMLHRFLTF